MEIALRALDSTVRIPDANVDSSISILRVQSVKRTFFIFRSFSSSIIFDFVFIRRRKAHREVKNYISMIVICRHFSTFFSCCCCSVVGTFVARAVKNLMEKFSLLISTSWFNLHDNIHRMLIPISALLVTRERRVEGGKNQHWMKCYGEPRSN